MTPIGSLLIESSPSDNLPLIGVVIVGGLYWLGGRRYRAAARRGAIPADRAVKQRWRDISFYLALVVLVFTLQEPLDHYADKLFWVHMVQHVLLLSIVPPLVMLAAPWMRVWRGLPLSWRRPAARWAVQGRTGAPLRGLARLVGRPLVAWGLLTVDIAVWHVPAVYDLTLRSNVVHYTEHATFLIFALFVWGQVIDSPPFHRRLSPPRRCGLVVATIIPQWILALMLAFATRPWYAAYSDLGHRPGGISALTDQHLAAGVMWVPAALPWALVVFITVYLWMAEEDREPPTETVRPRGPEERQPPLPPAPAVPPSAAPPSVQPSSDRARERVLVAATERRIHA